MTQPSNAAPATAVIHLGGRPFTIRRLTIGQLRVVHPLMMRAGGLLRANPLAPFEIAGAAELVDISIKIVAAALERDGIGAAELEQMEASYQELNEAVDTIAVLSGFKKTEGPPPDPPPGG